MGNVGRIVIGVAELTVEVGGRLDEKVGVEVVLLLELGLLGL